MDSERVKPSPLGLAVAAIIIIVLTSLAVPRLLAVTEERARPEAPRILSAYESVPPSAVMSCDCEYNWGGGVMEAR